VALRLAATMPSATKTRRKTKRTLFLSSSQGYGVIAIQLRLLSVTVNAEKKLAKQFVKKKNESQVFKGDVH
jgi:hypothetical protein